MFNKDLSFSPQHYIELFSAWYAIENSIEYNEKEDGVYNFCLFCNPKVQSNGKMLKWNDFIDAGITHIKDITFEVIPGFLPSSYIVDIILEKILMQMYLRSRKITIFFYNVFQQNGKKICN